MLLTNIEEIKYLCDLFLELNYTEIYYELNCQVIKYIRKKSGAINYKNAIYSLKDMQEKREAYIKENLFCKKYSDGSERFFMCNEDKKSCKPVDVDLKFLSFLMIKNWLKDRRIKSEKDIPHEEEILKKRRTYEAHIKSCILLSEGASTRMKTLKMLSSDAENGLVREPQWINVFSMLYNETGFYRAEEKRNKSSFSGFIDRFSRFRAQIETYSLTSFYARSIEDWAAVLSIYFGGLAKDFCRIAKFLQDVVAQGKTKRLEIKTTTNLKDDLINQIDANLKQGKDKEDILDLVCDYLKNNSAQFGRNTYSTIKNETARFVKPIIDGMTMRNDNISFSTLSKDLDLATNPYNYRILLIATLISKGSRSCVELCKHIDKMLIENGFSPLNVNLERCGNPYTLFDVKSDFDNVLVQYIYAKSKGQIKEVMETHEKQKKEALRKEQDLKRERKLREAQCDKDNVR